MQVDIKAGIPITSYTPSGLLFADGTTVQADVIVYATGYFFSSCSSAYSRLNSLFHRFRRESLVEVASRLLNYSLVDKVQSVGGWDAEHEVAGVWRPTGREYRLSFPLTQLHKFDTCVDPGLWFAGGDFFACRFYSRLLAMQIKADDEGLFKAA
jgi:hypothetical protein